MSMAGIELSDLQLPNEAMSAATSAHAKLCRNSSRLSAGAESPEL